MVRSVPYRSLQNRLLQWYRTEGRRFPWRTQHESAYRLTITETLLQQTRAETVAARRELFFEQFPDWNSLRHASLEGIEDSLRPFGLWKRRASSLKTLASEIEKLGDTLPTTRTGLEKLPGVGQYIANAIELMVFDRPRPLIDVNMARLLDRIAKARSKADLRYDPVLQAAARKLVGVKHAKDANFACLDLAALICLPRNPKCLSCPVSAYCVYFSEHRAGSGPRFESQDSEIIETPVNSNRAHHRGR